MWNAGLSEINPQQTFAAAARITSAFCCLNYLYHTLSQNVFLSPQRSKAVKTVCPVERDICLRQLVSPNKKASVAAQPRLYVKIIIAIITLELLSQ